MRFRNPNTGEVLIYRDIIPIFCKNGCDNCPIIVEVINNREQSCQTWIVKNPHEVAALMGYEVVEDDGQNEKMEVNKMEMNKVNAPVMGTYEVQSCPNCGAVPCVDITVKRRETVESVQYALSEEVYCACCGLSGASVEVWNKLRCVD